MIRKQLGENVDQRWVCILQARCLEATSTFMPLKKKDQHEFYEFCAVFTERLDFY